MDGRVGAWGAASAHEEVANAGSAESWRNSAAGTDTLCDAVIRAAGEDPGTALSFGLGTGERYDYRVLAFNAEGDSFFAGPASAMTVYSGPPLSDWLVVTDFGAIPDDGNDDTAAMYVDEVVLEVCP